MLSEVNGHIRFAFCFQLLGGIWTLWLDSLLQLKQFIKPSGHEILRELIESVGQYDKAFGDGDIPTLKILYHNSVKLALELLPHVTDSKVYDIWLGIANMCESASKKVADGGNLDDVAKMEKQRRIKLSAAVN